MKKVILTIALFLSFFAVFAANQSFADVMPRYMTSIAHTGIGAFNAPKEFAVYENPDENSKVLEQITWGAKGVTSFGNLNENDIFVTYVPAYNVAYCAVDDEIDGWVKIFYSQKTGKTGWVKATATNRFTSWMGFYMSKGRKNGVYFFKDMPETNKKLMSGPEKDSQKVASYTYPKFVKLTLVRGNWMLVTILDLGNETRVGWMQWRTEDGNFMIFPKMYKSE